MKKILALILAVVLGSGVFGVHLDDIINTAQSMGLSNSSSKTVAQAQKNSSYQGKVTAVADGDTIRVADNKGHTHKIRLAHIDAPEKNQAHGQAARQALYGWIMGKTVTIIVHDVDQYQREVAKIEFNGEDINLKLVQNGHAWHYRSIAARNQSKAAFAIYESAEKQAKSQRLGLWQQKNPQEPWAFRRQNRN